MFNATLWANFLAVYRVAFKFHGKPAHAAADPYNGRSALDAVELMNVGVNYLREHMIPGARVHYVITDGGGTAPNVVPAEAASLYFVRAPRIDQLNPLFRTRQGHRPRRCADDRHRARDRPAVWHVEHAAQRNDQ